MEDLDYSNTPSCKTKSPGGGVRSELVPPTWEEPNKNTYAHSRFLIYRLCHNKIFCGNGRHVVQLNKPIKMPGYNATKQKKREVKTRHFCPQLKNVFAKPEQMDYCGLM